MCQWRAERPQNESFGIRRSDGRGGRRVLALILTNMTTCAAVSCNYSFLYTSRFHYVHPLCLSVCLSVCLYLSLSLCLCLSVCLSVSVSLSLSLSLSVCLSVCLSLSLSLSCVFCQQFFVIGMSGTIFSVHRMLTLMFQ